MKKQKLPEIIIEGVEYELLISDRNYSQSVCYKCDLGLKRCILLYRDIAECPCYTLGPAGYRGFCYLHAKKAGQ
jgi:hypothetical protein